MRAKKGDISVRQEKYTIGDIADQLGVSRATVSRAMNGAPGVGPELRKKILEFAEGLGYKPNVVSQSLSKTNSKIIGLIFGDVRNPFYAELTFYIQMALNQYGYTVMLFNSEYNAQQEQGFIEMAKQFGLAGLILFTAQTDKKQLQEQTKELPIVLVNRPLDMARHDSVTMDNFKAGYIAAMHLIELGHRRIGFVRGQAISSASVQRFEGYRQALKSWSLTLREEDIMEGDLKMPTGYELAKTFFQREERPTGLIVANDMMALGILDWCNENGVSIPEELSVVSFDNINFSSVHGIELTTVSQHMKEMGRKAAELMVRRIREPQAEYKRIILEPTLIVRNTTMKYEE